MFLYFVSDEHLCQFVCMLEPELEARKCRKLHWQVFFQMLGQLLMLQQMDVYLWMLGRSREGFSYPDVNGYSLDHQGVYRLCSRGSVCD